MKIIELFNKIANDEEVPKKIKYKNMVYIYSEYNNQYYLEKNTGSFSSLRYQLDNFSKLNDEVEIIEEEKELPEKLDDEYSNNANGLKVVWSSSQQHTLKNKINEIIDYLESKEKGGK